MFFLCGFCLSLYTLHWDVQHTAKQNPARIDVVSVENDLAENRPFSHILGDHDNRFRDGQFEKTRRNFDQGQKEKKCPSDPGVVDNDSYHTSKSARVQTNTSLEPDLRRVLRSLGQDSSPAARTATTYTWTRGGARRHAGIRAAPYTMRGAARPRGLHSSSSSSSQKTRDQPLLLDPFESHMGQHRRAAGRRAQGAAHARASMGTLLLCALGLGLYSTLRTRSKGAPVG